MAFAILFYYFWAHESPVDLSLDDNLLRVLLFCNAKQFTQTHITLRDKEFFGQSSLILWDRYCQKLYFTACKTIGNKFN